MRRLLLIAGLISAPVLAQALDFKPSGRFAVAGNYSAFPGTPKNTLGANGEIFLIPALKQDNWTLLPLLAVFGKGANQAVVEDTFFVESYNFLAKPQLIYNHDDMAYKLYGGAKRSVNKETVTEVWSTGIYDYEEYSVGLGDTWKSPAEGIGTLGVALEVLHRTYMNFHELGTATATNGKNYYSKDYDGGKVSVDLDGPKDAAPAWSVGYVLLMKNYSDNYLVQKEGPQGSLAKDDRRYDMLQRGDFQLQGALSAQVGWSLNGGVDWNRSNQNYFDPTLLVFNEDFYGYVSENIGVALAWLPQGPEGPSIAPSYSITNRNYSGRRIRRPSGEFTRGMQEDVEHRIGLDGRFPLNSWAALTVGGNYLSVLSNQEFIQRINPTYDVVQGNLGVDIRF